MNSIKPTINISLIIYFCFCLCALLPAKAQEEVVSDAKADFIIDIGRKIMLPTNGEASSYRIGVYGHEKEVKKLYESLENRKENTEIHGKKLEVFLFKRMAQIEQVDLLYVSGNSKIRISSINKKLNESPYFIVTENFPFGTSAFNFKIGKDHQISYEFLQKNYQKSGLGTGVETGNKGSYKHQSTEIPSACFPNSGVGRCIDIRFPKAIC
jgi:hypothetical protein